MNPSSPCKTTHWQCQHHSKSSQDVQDLLNTLPKENGWAFPSLLQYQRHWYGCTALEAVMACQQEFQPRDKDVFLVTLPKSGTTWLKSLAFAILRREHYNANSTNPLLTSNPHELVPFLEYDIFRKDKLWIDRYNIDSASRIFSTHIPYTSLPESIKTSTNCKIVYLCRNPKDTFVSFWLFVCKVRSEALGPPPTFEEAHDMFCRGASTYGPFWEHNLGYWRASLERPETVLFMKYEDMKEGIKSQVKRLAEHLGCPFSVEEENGGVIEDIVELCSFENLKNLEINKIGKSVLDVENKNFFRKGVAGDWKNYLSPQMAKRLDQVIEEKLHGSGLTFKE